MAVTITASDLALALRIDSANSDQVKQVERLREYAVKAVEDYAPSAPAEIQNEAVVRLAGYLFDTPFQQFRGNQNAFRNAGSAGILDRYREIGASVVGSSGVAETTSSGGSSGGGSSGGGDTPAPSREVIEGIVEQILASEDYIDQSELTTELTGYVQNSDLTNYIDSAALTTALSAYVLKNALSVGIQTYLSANSFIDQSAIQTLITNSVAGFATPEVVSAINTAIANNVKIIEGLVSNTRDIQNREINEWEKATDGVIHIFSSLTGLSTSAQWNAAQNEIDKPAQGWLQSDVYVIARIPNGANPRDYRIAYYDSTDNSHLFGGGGLWAQQGESPRDSTYDYYATRISGFTFHEIIGDLTSSIELEKHKTGSETVWTGNITENAKVNIPNLTSQVIQRLLPSLADGEAGQIPQIDITEGLKSVKYVDVPSRGGGGGLSFTEILSLTLPDSANSKQSFNLTDAQVALFRNALNDGSVNGIRYRMLENRASASFTSNLVSYSGMYYKTPDNPTIPAFGTTDNFIFRFAMQYGTNSSTSNALIVLIRPGGNTGSRGQLVALDRFRSGTKMRFDTF